MSLVDKNTCIIGFKPPAPTCMRMVRGQHVLMLFLHISHIFEHERIRASRCVGKQLEASSAV